MPKGMTGCGLSRFCVVEHVGFRGVNCHSLHGWVVPIPCLPAISDYSRSLPLLARSVLSSRTNYAMDLHHWFCMLHGVSNSLISGVYGLCINVYQTRYRTARFCLSRGYVTTEGACPVIRSVQLVCTKNEILDAFAHNTLCPFPPKLSLALILLESGLPRWLQPPPTPTGPPVPL